MADPTVTVDLHQALDVEIHLSPQVAFHRELAVDDLAQSTDLVFREITRPAIRRIVVRARMRWAVFGPMP
jgi:hypothetical protein